MILQLSTIVVVLIITYFYQNARKYKDIQYIPGPKTLLFIGNALEFGNGTVDLFNNQMRLVKRYGTMVRIWVMSTLSLMITDPRKAEYILNSKLHTNKSAHYNNLVDWLGNGLITSKGPHWKKHRQLITPTFHIKILDDFSQYIHSNGQILISLLQKEIDKESTNIYPFINLYALDVIAESAMQTPVHAQINSDSEYVQAVAGFLKIQVERLFSVLRYDLIFRLSSQYWEQKKYVRTLKGFTENVINLRKRERMTANNSSSSSRKAFLDHLLDLQEKGNIFTDEEIREEVDTFMFTGHHTVSSAISFAIFEIAKYPQIQEKLLKEFNEYFGTDIDRKLTLHDIKNLKYLDMVFKECLRLNAPVPYIERELQESIIFDNLMIPRGTIIQILIYAMQRDPLNYSDPNKFDPDRFLPRNCKDRNPYIFIPFSAGFRNCIGLKYAELLMKTTILNILRNFKLQPVPGFTPILGNNSLLISTNGLSIKLLPRENKLTIPAPT